MSSSSDAQTIDSIYRDHHGWLRNWLCNRLGCTETAADLAQDTFFQVLAANTAGEIKAPKSYLATIANRLTVNLYRRRAIEQAYTEALAVLPEDTAICPERHHEIIETLVEIDAVLSSLPAKIKEVFLLSRLDGLTYKAIAERMSVSERTIKNYMAQAMLACLMAAGGEQE